MRFLLDTHVLIWLAMTPMRLPRDILASLEQMDTDVFFSTVNIWEIAVKRGLNRMDFTVEPRIILNWAREEGLSELPVTSEHGMAVGGLPPIHKDPFDRVLVAQAAVEGIMLLTADETVAAYPGPVRLV